jgi:hypothetical protein
VAKKTVGEEDPAEKTCEGLARRRRQRKTAEDDGNEDAGNEDDSNEDDSKKGGMSTDQGREVDHDYLRTLDPMAAGLQGT